MSRNRRPARVQDEIGSYEALLIEQAVHPVDFPLDQERHHG
jgi:hypothetical protein